jgi:hypothetical protein
VVERYRLLDYETAKEALERNAKENFDGNRGDLPLRIDPNYRGKHLQLAFTVDDEGVFTTPWSATITYRPGFNWVGLPNGWKLSAPRTFYSPPGRTSCPAGDKPDF